MKKAIPMTKKAIPIEEDDFLCRAHNERFAQWLDAQESKFTGEEPKEQRQLYARLRAWQVGWLTYFAK